MKRLLFIPILIIVACGDGENLVSDITEKNTELSVPAERHLVQPANSSTRQAMVESKVIRNANLEMQVESVEESTKYFEGLTKKFDAYISNSNQYNTRGQVNASLTIRVKEEQLDSLIEICIDEGIFLRNKSINSNDVTEQYIDTEKRLNNKKALEARYLELLERANNLSDVLEVEEKLGRIREEIESAQGRFNYLNDQINYSTLHLNYYEKTEVINIEPGQSFLSRLVASLKKGWGGFISFLIFVFYLWPFWILAFAGIFTFRTLRKKRKSKIK